MKNATKNQQKLEVEVLIHSDLDKENSFINVFSTKNSDSNTDKIPCKTAMLLVVT